MQQSTSNSAGMQVPDEKRTAGGEDRHGAHIRHIIEGVLWVIGLLVLATAAYVTHGHPGPYPGELELSRGIQSIHYNAIIVNWLRFVSALNDPIPSAVALAIWVVFLFIMRLFRAGIFLLLCVGVGNGIDALIGDLVQRPRPTPNLIHVDNMLKFNSFPSGHSCHMMVYYGFLLYLSFTKPVREWRYRWFLLPLQLFALLNILTVGFARLQQGEHWISDVLAGYLSGALWLFLFIFLYRWATDALARRKAAKMTEEPTRPLQQSSPQA